MNNNINEVKKDDSKAKRIIKLIGKIITYLFILLIVYVVLKVVVGFATKLHQRSLIITLSLS